MEPRIIAFDVFEATALAFSPDGRSLYALEQEGTLYAWTLSLRTVELRFKRTLPLSPAYALAVHPGGGPLLLAGAGGLLALSAADGSVVATLPSRGEAQCVGYAPDGQHLAWAGEDGRLHWLDGQGRRERWSGAAGERNAGLSFHPGGERLVVAASWPGGSRLLGYRVQGAELRPEGALWSCPVDALAAPAHSPCGQYLALGAHELWLLAADGRPRLLLDPLGRPLERPSAELFLGARWTAACFTPAGLLAAGSPADGRILLIDPARGLVGALPGHTGGAFVVAAHPAGGWLASSGFDATVRLWPLPPEMVAAAPTC